MKERAIAAFFARFRAVAALLTGLCCGLAILSSCSSRGDLELLNLRGVEIDEDAALLYVLGSGFVSGARCELALRGTAYPSGGIAEAIALELPCRALSDERSLVELGHAALARRPRGIFEGKLTMRLLADDGQRAVVGSLEPVRLRLGVYGRDDDVDAELSIARAASRFQRELGIRAVEATARGLSITALDESGKLATAGARVGDVVQRCAGAPVEEASDLLAAPGTNELSLVILRRGASPETLRVPLHDAGGSPFVLCFLAALLALIAALCLPAQPSVPAPFSARRELPWLGLAALLVLASWLLHGELDVGEPWFVAALVYKAHAWWAHARGQRSTIALVRSAVDAALASLCIAAFAMSLGSLRVPLFGVDASPAWIDAQALATPAGWLATWGLVFSVGPNRDRAAHEPALVLLRATSALELAVLGLGGGQLPLAVPWASSALRTALGMLWLLMLAAVAYRALSSGPRPQHPRSWAGVCAGLALVLSLLGPWLASHGLVPALCTALAVGFLAGRGLLRLGFARAARRSPIRDPALSPFL
jgi:hypothetical protein